MVKRYSTAELSNYFETPEGRFVTYEDYSALEQENARLREALEEIVEHGDSDCYFIALHALGSKDA